MSEANSDPGFPAGARVIVIGGDRAEPGVITGSRTDPFAATLVGVAFDDGTAATVAHTRVVVDPCVLALCPHPEAVHRVGPADNECEVCGCPSPVDFPSPFAP